MIDFMCIGAAKSGTTWLYTVLREHAGIYLPPVKEVNYFNKYHPDRSLELNGNWANGIEWYDAQFGAAEPGQLKGDFSTSYLDHRYAKAIYDYNPKLKIIAILRNPMERACSQYLFMKSRGNVSSGGIENLCISDPCILDKGFYCRHLTPYYEHFGSEQIKIILYEELSDPESVYEQALQFLGVDYYAGNPRVFDKVNVTKSVRSVRLYQILISLKGRLLYNPRSTFVNSLSRKLAIDTLLNRLFTCNSLPDPHVKQALLRQNLSALYARYRSDIDGLEKLIDRNLSAWKTAVP